VTQLEPGKDLLFAGTEDPWLFFLLKGELSVEIVDQGEHRQVNRIQAGEVFGDISMLLESPRTANIKAVDAGRPATVLGLDTNVFGRLGDFSLVSLQSKLIFYRNIVHNLRWKLEVYRSQHPEIHLADEHRRIKIPHVASGSFEELTSLNTQAKSLANLLVQWNDWITRSVTSQAS
jgi:CRP-like cAMP-binding protein